eukprot:UN26807
MEFNIPTSYSVNVQTVDLGPPVQIVNTPITYTGPLPDSGFCHQDIQVARDICNNYDGWTSTVDPLPSMKIFDAWNYESEGYNTCSSRKCQYTDAEYNAEKARLNLQATDIIPNRCLVEVKNSGERCIALVQNEVTSTVESLAGYCVNGYCEVDNGKCPTGYTEIEGDSGFSI